MAEKKNELAPTNADIEFVGKDLLELFQFCQDWQEKCGENPTDYEIATLCEKRNMTKSAIIDFWENLKRFKTHLEQAEKFVKTLFKVGGEEYLPDWAKYSKQSFTKTFRDAPAAIAKLCEIEGTPIENFAYFVSVKDAARAAGITDDRLESDLGIYDEETNPDGLVIAKPKERTLTIK